MILKMFPNYMKYNYCVDMSYLTTMKAYIYHKACKGKGCLLPLKMPQVVDPSGEMPQVIDPSGEV